MRWDGRKEDEMDGMDGMRWIGGRDEMGWEEGMRWMEEG